MSKISIVIPCYYNEENIPVTGGALIENELFFPKDTIFEYIFVDDGSRDHTFIELMNFHNKYPNKVKIVKLSKNFGANIASYAGIHHATGDCCVVLAADLQDPPKLIPEMFSHWEKGHKLVLAYKANREDSITTKFFSNVYHTLMRNYVLKNTPKGGFDLWLFDRQLRDYVVSMDEKNFYLPNLFMWLGYEYVGIPYTRKKREIGHSMWSLPKKINSFIDSFIAFSYLPIRLISGLGIVLGVLALFYSISVIYSRFYGITKIEGWSSLMIVVLFVSAFQMMSLGLLGEYLWRTLDSTRKRPSFVIDQIINVTPE